MTATTPRRVAYAAAIVPGLLVAAVYLADAHRAAGVVGFPLDDAWIHAQFARNVATGHGFTYTGGQWVSGSTAPLWTLVLALGYAIARNIVMAGLLLGIVLQAIAAIATCRLAEDLGATRPAALGAGAIAGLMPAMAWGAVSGMEVPLAAALVAAGLHLHFSGRASPRWRRYAGVVVLAAGALARPETLAISALVVASDLAGPGDGRTRVIRALTGAGLTLLVFSPLVVFSYATLGHPLPTTFYAKSGPGIVRALSTGDHAMALRDLTVFGPRALYNFWLVLVDQLSWTAYAAAAALALLFARRESRLPGLVLFATLTVVPFAMGLTAPQQLKPDNVRYAAQLLIVVPAIVAAGVSVVAPRAIAAAVVALLALPPAVRAVQGAHLYAASVRNIESLHVTAGRWVAAHLPPGTLLAVNDVGALAYFGKHRVLDLEGLVSPEVLPYRAYPDRGIRTVRDLHPDYILIFPGWYPDISGSPDMHEEHRFQITGNVISAGDTMILYSTPWTRSRLLP